MRLWFLGAVAAAFLSSLGPASAHGLGERYTLPLPLNLYLTGAALVVAFSFVLFAVFAGTKPKTAADGLLSVPPLSVPVLPGDRVLIIAVRGLSAALFTFLVIAGFAGSSDPFKNPLPVTVWIIGWVGIAFVCGLVGNIWALVNPWDNLFRLGERIFAQVRGRAPRPLLAYPAGLGGWPALALFFVFAWMELVWPERDHPATLAAVVLAYSAISWTGMAAFGRRTWIENGEAFAVAFGLLARFAVVCDREPGRVALRWPAVGLLVRAPVPPSVAGFALLMLATVTFDGLLETPLWSGIADWALANLPLQGMAVVLGTEPYVLVATAGLALFPMIFAATYLLVARLMVSASSAGSPAMNTSAMARWFVLTLVPIAIGYHLAHYLSYLLIAGQFIIPIASDPFALGWNLFGTRLYLIDLSVIDARSVWYASLALIVAGHVIAIWLAHTQAERLFSDRTRRLRSQVPMLLLMVGYTAVSLWILAQPITGRGA